MEFREILAQKMDERAETNYQLAKAIGVHQTSIKMWLDGRIPHLRNLAKLADHYGVTREQMIGKE